MSDKDASAQDVPFIPGNDPIVTLTTQDLAYIKSVAVETMLNGSDKVGLQNDDLFRTYCYAMGLQAFLRSRGLLKVILD